MGGDLRIVWFIGPAALVAVAFVGVLRGTAAVMRRRVRAGAPVSPPLKRWLAFFFACTRDGTLVIETPRDRSVVRMRDITEVRYHYHAVAGFVAWLEFVDAAGGVVAIDQSVRGVHDDVIPALERALPGFDRSALPACVRQGDVEDVCTVWRAAGPGAPARQ